MGYEMERNDSVCLDVDGEIVGMVNEHEIGIGYQRCRTFIPAANTYVVSPPTAMMSSYSCLCS
jgi:hypothetical protein